MSSWDMILRFRFAKSQRGQGLRDVATWRVTGQVRFELTSIHRSTDMRIIAGTYRGRRLRTLTGAMTRPTSDRLRETLFNILAPWIDGSRFLDICAGSGAVGIEALSRGAIEVT